ncbi:MAG: hypothetical protein ACHQIM_15200 [Sphingobacteriales bacterium]
MFFIEIKVSFALKISRKWGIFYSLNYHPGNWTPQQCIDFLVDHVGQERANAEGEVRRSFTGGYSPLYQVAYLTGGLQLMALKHELVDSGKMGSSEKVGDRLSGKQFFQPKQEERDIGNPS